MLYLKYEKTTYTITVYSTCEFWAERLKELTNFIVMADFDPEYESKDPKEHTSIQELIENPIFWIVVLVIFVGIVILI